MYGMSDYVYRNYDRERFEWQYNARLQVENNEEIVALNIERSESFRGAARCALDVSFGPGEREKLDLFLPERENAPVHLFIHGGYWRSRDKSMFSFLAKPLVEAGALVAVTNYDLCPQVTLDEIVRQIRAVAAWLWHNAERHAGNPEDIHVSGHSAGGHLAAMLAVTPWRDFGEDLPADLVKSTTPISGLFTLEPLIRHSVNDDLRLDNDAAKRNGPALMRPTTAGPVTVCVGGNESEEFCWQSKDLAARWKEHGARVSYVEVPGLNHFTILRDLGDARSDVTRRMVAQMGLA
jgi:arylformamidase